MENKVKFGFLLYEDMFLKLSEGIINQYDIIFTKDTKETFIISENLIPIAIKSKVYIFNSVEEAERKLNENTDTYVGQIVSILEENTYKGYIVNQNNNKYVVKPLCDLSNIDYNTLGNKPILNINGESNNPIVISNLDNGIYSITGHFKIASNDITIHLNPNPTIFIIEKDSVNDCTYINKIATKEIANYVVFKNNSTVVDKYVTEQFLKDNGYITSTYVDEKIVALGFLTKEEIQKYIEEVVPIAIGEQIVPVIDERIDKKILSATETQITSLFVNY